MSIRSRIEVEVSYAINALLILSAGVGAPPTFQFPLAPCEDLLDELLDLLEESSFDDEAATQMHEVPEASERGSAAARQSLPTYRDWIRAATEEEAELKVWTRRKTGRSRSVAVGLSGGSETDALSVITDGTLESSDVTITTNGIELEKERQAEHKAARALSILHILKNFSTMPDNILYLNKVPKVLDLLARLCQADAYRAAALDEESESVLGKRKSDDAGRPVVGDTVFTTFEAFRVRKDVLAIVSNLSGEALTLRNRPKDTVQALFELLSSFIVDARNVEDLEYAGDVADLAASIPPGAAPRSLPPINRKIPYHADMALDAFSRLALPDDNRQVLGEVISSEDQIKLAGELVKMLPVTEPDYQQLKTEPRLGYTERVAMCLYDLAFLAPPDVKLAIRRIPGVSGIVFRIVKRLSKAVPDFNRNPFSVLCRRLIEALRLISDSQDMFGAPPLLGLGGPSGGASEGSSSGFGSKGQVGLLLNDEEGVVEVLGTNELDGVIISELHALLALG